MSKRSRRTAQSAIRSGKPVLSAPPAPASAETAPHARLPQQRAWWIIAAALVVGTVTLVAGAYTLKTRATAGRDLERRCREFMALKNGGGPAADDLLTPAPAEPADVVSEQEAERLDAQFILHTNYEVADVRPEPDDPTRCVLVCKGNCCSRPLSVRTAGGVDHYQRLLSNPDIVVELKDGKLDGVRAMMRQEP